MTSIFHGQKLFSLYNKKNQQFQVESFQLIGMFTVKNISAKDQLCYIAARFLVNGKIDDVSPHGTGKVNDTYLVRTRAGDRFILQRINDQVFENPRLIMENWHLAAEHVQKKMRAIDMDERRWEFPFVRQTRQGEDFFIDRDGAFWRALDFIENVSCFDEVQNDFQAEETGYALGLFHRMVADLDVSRLHDTLPGFHITPSCLQHYDAVREGRFRQSGDTGFCHDFIDRRRHIAADLEMPKKQGRLLLRAIHGDPKLSNVLFDNQTGRAVALIDLDTLKPGLIQYDIGDCLRSCCNRAGEENPLSDVFFDPGLCRAFLRGYLVEARQFLSEQDCLFIVAAVRLISFELGLRFFTDFLEGDRYFKTERPGQNLQRAMVQFALTESIEAQVMELECLVKEEVTARTGK